MKRTVEINKEYGYLTVLKEVERDSFDHRQYLVRCRCGKQYIVRKGILFYSGSKCRECAAREYHKRVVNKFVGSVINDFEILTEHGISKNGAIVYKCRCLKCGSTVYRTAGELSVRKGQGCENCRPDYHFHCNGSSAFGTLKDGTLFIIDASMVPVVSEHYWGLNSDGYIECKEQLYKGLKLHRFILGVADKPKLIVDHINRNRLDCRLSNLRIVTAQQNSMNRSINRNSTSGYVGVTSFTRDGKYRARIGINNKYFLVYQSENIIECASAYNYASELLFKEFAGHRNAVPEADNEIKAEVRRRCSPYLKASEKATATVEKEKSA